MFRIKICGITNVGDAAAAVDAGADAIGLNFYEGSSRFVSESDAIRITSRVRISAQRVGVFVNRSAEEMNRIANAVGLSWVQLHGDESPQVLAKVNSSINPIRVYRLNDSYAAVIANDLVGCRNAGRGPAAIMIDAAAPGQYGGSGTTLNWTAIGDHSTWLANCPLILAGGLTPDNVAEAIRIVRPYAVDVASGVESSPGKKDPMKVRDFVAAARGAFGL